MKIVKEFSRFAEDYKKHNMIQLEVASRLTLMLEQKRYVKVLDLGCGSGAVYDNFTKKNISTDKFIAFDFSKEMLALHPSSSNIEKVCSDFNNKESFLAYKKSEFDILISASALQWSNDLSTVLKTISLLADKYYFAFFTSKTFATLHQTAGIQSPIYSKEFIIEKLNKYYKYELEVVEYQLSFSSVREMFQYIKRSGVSGGSGQLSYGGMKRLMREYPLDYLEFEVLFVKAVKS
ncbi:MAG: methyltransferase [Sulfurovum sp.]|nr:MAG: methyltransferase [Sulfurovum sp.]